MGEREGPSIKTVLRNTAIVSGVAFGIALGTPSPSIADSSPKPEATCTSSCDEPKPTKEQQTAYLLIMVSGASAPGAVAIGYMLYEFFGNRRKQRDSNTENV